jgi:hypothetical protein
MRSFFLSGVIFLLCFSLKSQSSELQPETLDEANPLYFPIDSGFVFFVAEEGKIMFAREETNDFSMADSLIDLNNPKGRLSIVIDEDTTYYTYNLVDVTRVFNPTKSNSNNTAGRSFSSARIQRRVIDYNHEWYNTTGTVYWENLRNIQQSFKRSETYSGRYRLSQKEMVDYQFSVFENKFAFFTTNSNRIVVFDKLGNVEAFSALNPTEPFIYVKKHQSIYYDEVQEKFYLLNTTNLNYNWYVINPSSGETKLLQQIKKLSEEPGWWVRDGVLHYSITDNENQTTTLYDVPLY